MVYIAGDKHGFKAITFVENFLRQSRMLYKNLGVKHEQKDVMLEDMIPAIVSKVKENKDNKGILICGTGIGVEVGANKFSGIRACLATNETTARWSIEKDNCNVLCLAGWESDQQMVTKILTAWFNATYDGSERRSRMFEVFDSWH